jgi:hypothetical protein
MHVRIACAACILVLTAVGSAAHSRSARAQGRAQAVSRELAAVRELLRDVPPPDGDTRPDARGDGIGALLQRAARAAGMEGSAISEVRAAGPDRGPLASYRVRLGGVTARALVRFVHALESDAGLRAGEIDVERRSPASGLWDASLLLVRTA